jgi:RNA polymerase sigma-70 factor (ECF subfamily)
VKKKSFLKNGLLFSRPLMGIPPWQNRYSVATLRCSIGLHSAFRILHNKEDAEDAVQDSLCKAYAKLQSFQGRASFSTWLTRIAINSAVMVRRRRNGRPETPLEEILDARPHRLQREIVDAALDPEQLCSETEIRQLLEEHLPQLPPRLRDAFQLRELDGLSASDSCRVLGIRKNAFKSRISRARRKLGRALRKSLNNHGLLLASLKFKVMERG